MIREVWCCLGCVTGSSRGIPDGECNLLLLVLCLLLGQPLGGGWICDCRVLVGISCYSITVVFLYVFIPLIMVLIVVLDQQISSTFNNANNNFKETYSKKCCSMKCSCLEWKCTLPDEKHAPFVFSFLNQVQL